MAQVYDKIIVGAGLYGLYAAYFCAKRGQKVIVLECDAAPFKRATYINQARVHMGYHYPRSLSTAMKSAGYFERFCRDYDFCVHKDFKQIYATSAGFSWTGADEFVRFCRAAGIECERISTNEYFNENVCDGAFLTKEYTYDAHVLRDYLLDKIEETGNVEILCSCDIKKIEKSGKRYAVSAVIFGESKTFEAPFLLNATYASVNQINAMAGFDAFAIKYELCEIILCRVGEKLKNVGLTVMDGPFFSIMPFGMTGYHSLTAVTRTPHVTSYDTTPVFACQKGNEKYCNPGKLGNCNDCPNKPESAWGYMNQIALKYVKPEFEFVYAGSLYSMKPILKASEVDDSRPTLVRVMSEEPTFISVLSGKINTVYDLDEYLE